MQLHAVAEAPKPLHGSFWVQNQLHRIQPASEPPRLARSAPLSEANEQLHGHMQPRRVQLILERHMVIEGKGEQDVACQLEGADEQRDQRLPAAGVDPRGQPAGSVNQETPPQLQQANDQVGAWVFELEDLLHVHATLQQVAHYADANLQVRYCRRFSCFAS